MNGSRCVVVVGGGPAGLAAAYRLSAHPDIQVTLLERGPAFGGLAAGMEHNGMRLDFGPHRLHQATDPEVLADLRSLLGSELKPRQRRGRIFLRGRYLPYPPGPAAVLALGPATSLRLAAGLLFAGTDGHELTTYESVVVEHLGRPLYDLFYGPYAEKVWGLPGSKLAAEQATRRVNQRSPIDFLRLVLGSKRSNRFYYYPAGGFGRITDAYVGALQARRNVRLVAAASVGRVRTADGRVVAVEFSSAGDTRSQDVDDLVWSAPITDLVRMTDGSPEEVRQAAGRLRYRSLVMAYAQVAIPQVGEADTYYFPEAHFPFNRVAEQKQFSPHTVPADSTVLVMDLACDPDEERFTATDDEIRALVSGALCSAGLLKSEALADFWTRRFRYAYPVYDLSSASALATLQSWADARSNVWLIGRQGLFLHNNTHHSLLMGYRAADAISQDWSRERWRQQLEVFSEFNVED